ncbi:uncharacterized protein LOC121393829 isoform X1 [Xenopus laevis]|uniref:ribonuclease H n=1 Tax=Xenopus laevis TaxID=8355 RepID=A0A8J1KQ25_XENLA|nr:uncharacterized protein LOC121393829 isoform X1 [Xenopus laevis]
MISYVQQLLKDGAILPVPREFQGQGIYSVLFMLMKKTGDFRPILDLRSINVFLQIKRFRMESIYSIIKEIQIGDWLLSLDLKDAYFHIPVAVSHQKFLRFALSQDLHYQFTCLPFGLATSPRVFSKVLQTLIAEIRRQGIQIFHYLDDILMKSQDPQVLTIQRDVVIRILQDHGWVLNLEKSQLVPSQDLIYLGARFLTVQGLVTLPDKKKEKIKAAVRDLMQRPWSSAREVSSVLGLQTSTFPMLKWARWQIRPLQSMFLNQWNSIAQDWNQRIVMQVETKDKLRWWMLESNLSKGLSLEAIKWKVITTDSSPYGWGAHVEGYCLQGLWKTEEQLLPANVLELRAVWKAIQQCGRKLKGAALLVKTDNMAAVSYIRKQGGTHSQSLIRELYPIMTWAESNLQDISAIHLPGKQNVLADFLSRARISRHEWELNPKVFIQIVQKWGLPDVDLMATTNNRKVDTFFSRFPCNQTAAVDALQQDWSVGLLYIFPPTPLIPHILRKIRAEKADIIAIIPDWPRRSWYPMLRSLVIRSPWRLPQREDILSQGPVRHPNPHVLCLTAWRLRGKG